MNKSLIHIFWVTSWAWKTKMNRFPLPEINIRVRILHNKCDMKYNKYTQHSRQNSAAYFLSICPFDLLKHWNCQLRNVSNVWLSLKFYIFLHLRGELPLSKYMVIVFSCVCLKGTWELRSAKTCSKTAIWYCRKPENKEVGTCIWSSENRRESLVPNSPYQTMSSSWYLGW